MVSDIVPIVCAHEQGAGYMADGYARATHQLGVVIVHGGPGVHNVVTAIKTAFCEKVPLLCLSGDVPTTLTHYRAFHNTNSVGTQDQTLLQGMTKLSYRVTTSQELPFRLEEAIRKALEPPCGPVHLVVPFDVLNDDIDVPDGMPDVEESRSDGEQADLTGRFMDLLLSERRVVLWVGDTLNRLDCAEDIRLISERYAIPVMTTYCAKGVLPEDHEFSLGNYGFAGRTEALDWLESGEVDTVLALDVDWSERNTANWCAAISEYTEVLLFNQSWTAGVSDNVVLQICDPVRLLQDVSSQSKRDYNGAKRRHWIARMKQLCAHPSLPPPSSPGEIEPEILVRTMREVLPRHVRLFVDAGLHRVYAGKYWQSFEADSFFSSSILAATGWGIAAGIGAQLRDSRPVVILTGDGCMLMQGMELHTAVKYRIPVTVVVMDNGGFASMVRRLPDATTTQRGDFSFGVDWPRWAQALGAEARSIHSTVELVSALAECSVAVPRVLFVKTPCMPHFVSAPSDRPAYNT